MSIFPIFVRLGDPPLNYSLCKLLYSFRVEYIANGEIYATGQKPLISDKDENFMQ